MENGIDCGYTNVTSLTSLRSHRLFVHLRECMCSCFRQIFRAEEFLCWFLWFLHSLSNKCHANKVSRRRGWSVRSVRPFHLSVVRIHISKIYNTKAHKMDRCGACPRGYWLCSFTMPRVTHISKSCNLLRQRQYWDQCSMIYLPLKLLLIPDESTCLAVFFHSQYFLCHFKVALNVRRAYYVQIVIILLHMPLKIYAGMGMFTATTYWWMKARGNFYSSLVISFTEFNRISIEVLSVVAVQVKCIQDAIKVNVPTFFSLYVSFRIIGVCTVIRCSSINSIKMRRWNEIEI